MKKYVKPEFYKESLQQIENIALKDEVEISADIWFPKIGVTSLEDVE